MLTEAFQRMLTEFGPQHWWPGESPFEVIVGAVLTQNTNWQNVELAIENLRIAGLIDLHVMHGLKADELEKHIRPAGYFRLKAKRLKNVVQFIVDDFGDMDSMFLEDTSVLRDRLLAVNGVGPETADSILLYAGNRPTFVVDAYTGRIAKRHGWVKLEATYTDLQEFFETGLAREFQLYNEYHALIVRLGKDFCKPLPRCEDCPLRPMIPESGIVDLQN